MIENYFRLVIMQLYISNSNVYMDESNYVTVGILRRL